MSVYVYVYLGVFTRIYVCDVDHICTLEHIIGLLFFKYYSVVTQGKSTRGED